MWLCNIFHLYAIAFWPGFQIGCPYSKVKCKRKRHDFLIILEVSLRSLSDPAFCLWAKLPIMTVKNWCLSASNDLTEGKKIPLLPSTAFTLTLWKCFSYSIVRGDALSPLQLSSFLGAGIRMKDSTPGRLCTESGQLAWKRFCIKFIFSRPLKNQNIWPHWTELWLELTAVPCAYPEISLVLLP